MSIDFDWSDEPPSPKVTPPPKPRRTRKLLLFAFTLVGLMGAGWLLTRWLRAPATATIAQEVDALILREATAFSSGDGVAFFATQPDDPAWQAAQFWPESLTMHRAGRAVQSIKRQDREIEAQLAWTDDDGLMTRTAFYHWGEDGPMPVADAPWFWGPTLHQPQEWGTLLISDKDDEWSLAIANFMTERRKTLCEPECPADRFPVTLEISRYYTNTAAPNRIVVPSPHLVAVDTDGLPGPAFWAMLDARVIDYLIPGAIRFAVPAEHESTYLAAAQRFQAEHPAVTVEIVPVADPAELDLTSIDGALIAPNADQIAAGHIVDLTDYAATAPAFDLSDFHYLLRSSAHWRDRLWVVPIAGHWALFQSDVDAHAAAGLDPAPPASWAGLAGQIVRLDHAAGNAQLHLPFADLTGDSLHALAGATQCSDDPQRCPERLTPEAVRSALSWYGGILAVQPDTPNFAAMSQSERRNYALNHLSRPREIAAWIESPVYYEHNVQIAPLTLAPLPAGASVASTPIHLLGGVISTTSEHPRDVWMWLDYLSRERPLNEPRALPGRASVTIEIGFWTQMPEAVRGPLLAGLVAGRSVRIDERNIFRGEIMAALHDGTITPAALAEKALEIKWFGSP